MSEDIKKYYEALDSKYKHKYQYIVKDDFGQFLKSLEEDILSVIDPNRQEIYKKKLKKSRYMIKKRWYDSLFEGQNTPLKEEIEFTKTQFLKYKAGILSEKESSFVEKIKDVRAYEKALEQSCNTWLNNINIDITSFRYLETKNKRSLVSAFKSDMLNFCINNDPNEIKEITRVPSIIGEIPIDTKNRSKYVEKDINFDEIEIQLESNSTIDKLLYVDESTHESLILQIEKDTLFRLNAGENVEDSVTKIAILKSLKTFNDLDKKIIIYFYNHFTELYSGKRIEKYISQIVDDLGLHQGKKNRDAVTESIAKIASMNVTQSYGEKVGVFAKFFSAVITEESGRRKVQVSLDGIIEDVIIKDNTINFFKGVYDSLSEDAQQLAVMLQKSRIRLVLEGKGNTETKTPLEFSRSIFWGTKRVDLQMKRILNGLEELKNKGVVVRSYFKNKRYDIEIEYIPFVDDDIKIIRSSDFKTGALIEGATYVVKDSDK